jgi:hypothetical protein
MASWGNAENAQNPQDMDSNGQKLAVRSGGTPAGTNYRVDIEELSDASRRALFVLGQTKMAKAIGQTSLVLDVSGKAKFTDASDVDAVVIETLGKTVLAHTGDNPAVEVDDAIKIVSGATHGGTIKADTSDPQNTILSINSALNDPDVQIGAGDNIVTLTASQLRLGSSAEAGINTAIRGPVRITGNAGVENLDVVGNAKVREGFVAASFDVNIAGNNVTFGGNNADETVNLGESGDGTLGVHSDTDIGGSLYVGTTTELAGAANIGSSQNPADLTVNGNTTVNGHSQINGNVDVDKELTVKSDTNLNGKAFINNTSTFNDVATFNVDASFTNSIKMNGTKIDMGGSGADNVVLRAQNGRLEELCVST